MIQIIELLNGDCLELMSNISDKSIDMIFCDLPYGTTNCDFDKKINLVNLWQQYKRIIKDNGVIALWCQVPFNIILGTSNLEMLRYEWIVEKTSATGYLNAKRMPMKAHENLMIFYKHLPTYNPQKTYGHERKVSTTEHKRNSKLSNNYHNHNLTTYDSTERYPRDVLTFKWDKQKCTFHPQQKPVKACEYFISTYTNVGDKVLDNCMGSGSTGVACVNTNRSFIGIELDNTYFEIAKQRINDAQEQLK